MKTLLQKFNFCFLILFLFSAGLIISTPANALAGDSCIVSGPTLVPTNVQVAYTTTLQNQNWEVYSYDGADAQIVSFNDDSLVVATGPNPGRYTVYVLSNPQKNELCSLNVNVDAALPVELSSFNADVNERNVHLHWTTLSEQNNSGFEIERSINKSGWSSIGFVSGKGTISAPVNYSFEDRNISPGRYSYRLKQIDYNGNFQYFELQNEVFTGLPVQFTLHQNYPNPFNPNTNINFDIADEGHVKIRVYDISGKEVKTLVDEFKSAGFYTLTFEASELAGGLYFYKLEYGNLMLVKKMVLIK